MARVNVPHFQPVVKAIPATDVVTYGSHPSPFMERWNDCSFRRPRAIEGHPQLLEEFGGTAHSERLQEPMRHMNSVHVTNKMSEQSSSKVVFSTFNWIAVQCSTVQTRETGCLRRNWQQSIRQDRLIRQLILCSYV